MAEDQSTSASRTVTKTQTARSQSLLIDEETTATVFGFRQNKWKTALFIIFSVLTGGLLYLFGRWFPVIRAYLTCDLRPLDEADHVYITIPIVFVKSSGLSKKSSQTSFEKIVTIRSHDGTSKRFMFFRQLRYLFDPSRGEFVESSNFFDASSDFEESGVAKNQSQGLSEDDRKKRFELLGSNLIDIGRASVAKILLDEVLHPFYIFQLFSVIVWCCNEYYYFAACIFFVSVLSLFITLVETIRNLNTLRKMAKYVCNIDALRNGEWKSVESTELVPGDIIDVNNLHILPCDAILLSGSSLFDESTLTGESIPVPKISLSLEGGKSVKDALNQKKFQLFSGSRLIRSKPDSDNRTRAIVTKTGFLTSKGLLVRLILFPKPNDFSFERDSFIFIFILAILALVGFFYGLPNLIKLELGGDELFLKFCDLVTIAVPPALPASMAIGTVIAISRLKKKKIYCISPTKMNVAGKLNILCFDKTGTLTEEGLDVAGVSILVGDQLTSPLVEGKEIQDREATSDLKGQPSVLHTLATCHGLKDLNGTLIGEPIDLKMFEFTGATLKEIQFNEQGLIEASDVSKTEAGNLLFDLRILKLFEFEAPLQRMSVLLQDKKASQLQIHCKGAPETIASLCIPESVPKNFAHHLDLFTGKGFRVLGLASKIITVQSCPNYSTYLREDAEKDLVFRGLLILENKLKPETFGAIQTFHKAGFKLAMITGDNLLTAVNVARNCRLMDPDLNVFVPKEDDQASLVEGKQMELYGVKYDMIPIKSDPSTPSASKQLAATENETQSKKQNYELALTGKQYLALKKSLPGVSFQKILLRTAVFARMSPDLKKALVEDFSAMQYTVGMCGDGANDCGSLRAAHVGLSLAETEASVAAPFSSKVQNISAMVRLVRHGRCALVTSLACFKFMALYSMIQSASVVILFNVGSYLGNFQFLYQDLFLVLPLAAAMAWMKPKRKIYSHKPISNLISKKVVISILAHVGLQAATQGILFSVLPSQEFYLPPGYGVDYEAGEEWDGIVCQENTTIFFISILLCVNYAVIYSVGRYFRRTPLSNFWLLGLLIFAYGFSLYMVLGPEQWIIDIMELTDVPMYWRGAIVGAAALQLVVGLIFEFLLVPGFIFLINLIQARIRKVGNMKAYQMLQADLVNDPISDSHNFEMDSPN